MNISDFYKNCSNAISLKNYSKKFKIRNAFLSHCIGAIIEGPRNISAIYIGNNTKSDFKKGKRVWYLWNNVCNRSNI